MFAKRSVARRSVSVPALALSCLLPFLPVLTPAAGAQQGGIGGAWRVEFPRRVENDGSGERVTEVGVARVSFEVKGDSVFGRWEVEGGPPSSTARRLAGTVNAGKYHLTAEPFEAIMRGPDGDSRVKLVGTYDLSVVGDSLTGTQQMQPQNGGPAGPALPLKGSREKR